MSDTTTSAPPSPAPQSAPTQHEVPINQEPVSSQNPVTNTPPEKPAEDRATRRRADLQKAFDRANDPKGTPSKDADRPAPKAAEARKGHNQPPESTPDEKRDLHPSDQPRDRGRFAPRQQGESQGGINGQNGNAENAKTKPGTNAEYQRLPPQAPYADPPPRMAEHAKRDWAAAPESVRGEVYRMHQEYQGAYERYRGAAEAFEPVRAYHEMARQHGTTLDRALHNYVTMEQKLRQDVVGGLDIIVNNLNLRTPDGQKLSLQDVAYHVLSQSPDQHKLLQQQNAQQAAAQQIGSLHQEINGLKSHLQQMYAAQQFNQIRGGVEHYADDGKHPRFDELGDLIKREIDLGFDLDTAYRRAELLRPATHAAQTGNPSAQTRPTDKSIYGAPAGPSNGTGRKSEKPVGRREAIQKAIRAANGAL